MRVAILQAALRHYRVPLFHRVGQAEGLELTVAVAEPNVPEEHLAFSVWPQEVVRLGPLYWTQNIGRFWSQHDVMVVPFDMRWINRLTQAVRHGRPAVVWWGHGFGRRRLGNWVRRRLLSHGDAVLLYDESSKHEFIEAGFPQESIFVAHNTVHVPNAGIDREVERNQFLYVGRLQTRKRIDEAIRAFARARLSTDIGFTVLGDGPIRNDLRACADHEGVGARVRFVSGTSDHDALRAEFARSLAYLSPGHVGLGVLHSFAYGVPVITRRFANHAPEVNNLRHGINGMYYEGGVDALADRLRTCADQTVSLRLGEAGHEHYSLRRSMDGMAENMVAAIRWAARRNVRAT